MLDRLRQPLFGRQRIQPEQRPVIGALEVLVQTIQEPLFGCLILFHHIEDQRPGQNLAAGIVRPPALDEQMKLSRFDLLFGVDQAVVSPAAISITAMAPWRSRPNCSGLDEAA